MRRPAYRSCTMDSVDSSAVLSDSGAFRDCMRIVSNHRESNEGSVTCFQRRSEPRKTYGESVQVQVTDCIDWWTILA